MIATCIPYAARQDKFMKNEFKMSHHIRKTTLKDATRELMSQLVSMRSVKEAHVAGDGSLIVIYADDIRPTGSPQGIRFSVSNGQIQTTIERAINRFARLLPDAENGFGIFN